MDRETGKPKGFGFCEFFDKATAESAYRCVAWASTAKPDHKEQQGRSSRALPHTPHTPPHTPWVRPCRNLNNTDFKGRPVRLDYAEEEMTDRDRKVRSGRGGER